MRVLGLGAGGGINDEEAGLAGGSIDGLGDGGGARLDVGLVLVISVLGGVTSLLFDLASSLLLRENEGTASFGWIALDLGVASSCSISSGSDSCSEGALVFVWVVVSSTSEPDCSLAGKMPRAFKRSHGGKALRVASG
jgi:hypothetical protein